MSTVLLGDLVTIKGGGTPDKSIPAYWGGSIPWASVKDFKSTELYKTVDSITADGIANSATNLIPAGSIIVPTRMAVGKAAINTVDLAINQDLKALLPNKKVDTRYLLNALLAKAKILEVQATGATVKGITLDVLRALEIPLPPLDEQRRIAAILDQADALRRKRREALLSVTALKQAAFIDMFGDPAVNPHLWPIQPLGDLSLIFSDGPFGSNLKSEHYVERGIRVVRLQNIGIDEFKDEDAAYVLPEHFLKLKKHQCLPGDLLIGTLGDPNLRACVQPENISIALNKADCVQMRCDPSRAVASYVCALLNCPSTEAMAQSKIQGQTRLRISMGRLRELLVPAPPLNKQHDFESVATEIDRLKAQQLDNLFVVNSLFSSLQDRAFRGEL